MDRPYESNAGPVYDQFVMTHVDVSFNFDDILMEPEDIGYSNNSEYCKEDMVKRKVPCLVVLEKKNQAKDTYYDTFDDVINASGSIKIYFGDSVEDIIRKGNPELTLKDKTINNWIVDTITTTTFGKNKKK